MGEGNYRIGNLFASLVKLDATKIETLPAVTWQGDLVGSTAKAYEFQNAVKGYNTEFPVTDFEGDVLGVVLATNNLIDPSGMNLANELSASLAFDNPYIENRYEYFADAIGLDIESGIIQPESAANFLTHHQEMVADLGSGFYGSTTKDPSVLIGKNQDVMETYASEQISRFLEQLQESLNK